MVDNVDLNDLEDFDDLDDIDEVLNPQRAAQKNGGVKRPRRLKSPVRAKEESSAQTAEAGESTPVESAPAPSAPAPEQSAQSAQRLDRGSDEYLATHPRISSVIASAVLSVLGLLAAASVFYVGVWTLTGQYFDSWMWSQMAQIYPSFERYVPVIFTDSHWIIGVSVGMIVAAFAFAIARKRFWTAGTMIVFMIVAFGSSFILKRVLPRPVLDSFIPDPANSAPSGHTAFTMIAGVLLVMAVPRVLRALATLWAMIFSTAVGVMVIYDGWHRPTDALTAILLVGALGLLAMAFTRASGMDEPGTRKSSVSVQITSTVLIVAGLCASAYGTYIVSQLYSLVQYRPEALAVSGVQATLALILGQSAAVFGCLLAVRHATAAPLTRQGVMGAPPVPPRQ
ncbi:phosphatase PAP2 family protein [Alloscardovia macacae]|uniref:PAP2 family protein n=1 Tax=Alloscardovia macacae TaxID=1160091 RepID=A0A261F3Z9_9BIFI|nr:phosphatase PAP2 family protein [Alloscardovia macacae]OZG53818.1 PAP2 family protein [Alloscardovia macacae]